MTAITPAWGRHNHPAGPVASQVVSVRHPEGAVPDARIIVIRRAPQDVKIQPSHLNHLDAMIAHLTVAVHLNQAVVNHVIPPVP